MSLKGKVAIVTGGNSGIGLAIVLELARQGASIVIDYVSHPEATAALEKQVAALGSQVIGVDANVSKVADLQKLIAAAVQKFGRLDIIVNNAGVETRTSILDTTEEQYEKVLQINLKSAVLCHAVGRPANDQARGRRQHYQHYVGPRRLADAWQHGLLPLQRRHAHAHPHCRRGARAA